MNLYLFLLSACAITLPILPWCPQMRYSLIPSLIAAGTEAAHTGFPLVARADLFWPEHYEVC